MKNKLKNSNSYRALAKLLCLFLCTSFCLFAGCKEKKNTDNVQYSALNVEKQKGIEFTLSFEGQNITGEEAKAAKQTLKERLIAKNITNNEINVDYENKQFIVRFYPDEDDDEMAIINDISQSLMLRFYKGIPDAETLAKKPDYYEDDLVLTGADVEKAEAGYDGSNDGYFVLLSLTDLGTSKFSVATAEQVGDTISVWMDDVMISAPTVNAQITDGNAMIFGLEDYEEAKTLADSINVGALPFSVSCDISTVRYLDE